MKAGAETEAREGAERGGRGVETWRWEAEMRGRKMRLARASRWGEEGRGTRVGNEGGTKTQLDGRWWSTKDMRWLCELAEKFSMSTVERSSLLKDKNATKFNRGILTVTMHRLI